MSISETPDWIDESIKTIEGDDVEDAAVEETPAAEDGADDQDEAADGGQELVAPTAGKGGKEKPGGKSGDPKPAAAQQPSNAQPLTDQAGRTIANAGFERRNLERMPTTRRYISDLQTQLSTMTQANEVIKQSFKSIEALGATPIEAVHGAKLLKDLQAKPGETIAFLLQEAQKRGINVLPKDKTGFDPALLRAMVEDAVKPLIGDREAKVQEDQIAQRAAGEAQAFFSQYPEAKTHESVIAKMVGDGYTPREALAELKLYAANNQLDFSKDLRAQVQARSGTQPAKGGERNGRPLPSATGGGVSQPGSRSESFEGTASFDEILRSAFKDVQRAR